MIGRWKHSMAAADQQAGDLDRAHARLTGRKHIQTALMPYTNGSVMDMVGHVLD